MTDKEKLTAIKAEIERLKEETSIGLSEHENGVEQGRMEIIDAISILLDTLQEKPVIEELEEAAKRYATEGDEISGLYIIEPEADAFKAGAKWQFEQLMPNIVDATIGLPYENKDGGYTHLIDVSRPLPVGNNKIAIIFKEDRICR